ncbi:ribonuclease domain-containing protein [Pseudoxanthomonas mexicana]|uniref:ribonuclease domain-containing protein n=1 Tax=Pseudoxanthomonas mexicana TaxID=128785 RepID=UPI00398B88FF
MPWLIMGALLIALAGWFWSQRLNSPEALPAPPASESPLPSGNDGLRSEPLELPPPSEPAGQPPPAPAAPPRSSVDAPAPAVAADLPPQAHEVLRLIARGGPFPHRQDGSVFGNRERLLPQQPRGYYREYTVDTPGLGHRGARRIVAGGQPPREFWYTDDHYASFRPIAATGAAR